MNSRFKGTPGTCLHEQSRIKKSFQYKNFQINIWSPSDPNVLFDQSQVVKLTTSSSTKRNSEYKPFQHLSNNPNEEVQVERLR